MDGAAWQGILIPFAGTSLGAACVFVMRRRLNAPVRRALTGFAAGVMIAASVWSLIIPAMEQSAGLGPWAFLPAVLGFWAGVLFLLLLDRVLPCLSASPGHSAMQVLAVTLHNLPEGMAVGAVAAAWLRGGAGVTAAGMLALSLGIAIQNFPEGAIISMPLRAEGLDRGRAFACGVLSGAVEPIGALATVALSAFVVPLLPYLLGFAAGAMAYVVVAELIPGMQAEPRAALGTLAFALGFTLMMSLDVALG